ncbi:MAG: alpha/beta fold hydrolase [Candidatus Omnitrophota bacterium]|nr:alpha/beta hydrolase [Candidatus Omnitrophota bacterium]
MKKFLLIIRDFFMSLKIFKPAYTVENEVCVRKTSDGKKISLKHYKTGHSKVLVLAHGFFNSKDTYFFTKMSRMFSKKYDVISFDFRGHGKSEGLFSWTAYEEKDLAAVIAYAKEKEYKKIGVIGFSLGGAITIIETSQNKDIDSIIIVSAPYDFWKIDYHFWEEEMINDLKLNIGIKGEGKGVRPGNPFLQKTRPIDVIDKVKVPVFFVHGGKDWLIKPEHSRKLFDRANNPKSMHIVQDAGHSEKIFDGYPSEFEKLCVDWFDKTLK